MIDCYSKIEFIYYHLKMDKLIFKLFYSKPAFSLYFALIAVFAVGCAQNIAGMATQQIQEKTAKAPEIHFCPRDDCGKVFEMRINSANSSVYCAFYDIELKNIINALAKKSKAVDVRLVMDSSNFQSQIKGDGVRMDDDEQLMHNKFCVIDGKIVLTGSFNPTENDNYYNKNNVVVVYSKLLAGNYEDEFDELWNGNFGGGRSVANPVLYINGIKVENYFCPEDDCASHLIGQIKNAKTGVYFMSFSFTNEGIADALIMKGGLDIRGILDSTQSSGKFSQFKRLQEFGLKVRKDADKHKMHHKVFIIDNQTVATGSFNPTLSADTKNDENLLIIHDKKVADEFLKEFDDLWV